MLVLNTKNENHKVEVMISNSHTFANNSLFSKMMPLKQFLEYDGIMVLYLAQYPIYTKLTHELFYFPQKTINSGKLKCFQQKLRKLNQENFKKVSHRVVFPQFLQNSPFLKSKLSRINVWASKNKTKSKLHYDFYENFLTVLKGRKTVYLWKPDDPIIKQNLKSNIKSCHEGAIDFTQFYQMKKVKLLLKKRPPLKNKLAERYNELSEMINFVNKEKFKWLKRHSSMKFCVLEPGEMLYIPEGWWHFVISTPKTLAMNFWMDSVFVKI